MNTNTWSVSDVANYLKQIGLGQYSDSFIKNDIDGTTLLDLDEEKLKQLGITSIGHRIKLMRFINRIRSRDEDNSLKKLASSSELPDTPKVDTDSIRPLQNSIHYHIFVSENENNDPIEMQMIECQICHQKIPTTFYDHHEKTCRSVFLQCQREYKRRGINLTDDDIIDLMNGKVPIHHIKLEKCQYCGRKFAPSTFAKHENQCKKRMLNVKASANNQASSPSNNPNPSDFKTKHKELVELIRSQRKEKMNQLFFAENAFPVVKMEATEVF